MRRYENDLKMGVAAGLSESQAALHAATRNPEAFGSGLGSAVTAFNKAAMPAPPAAPPLGQVSSILDPATGSEIAKSIQRGPNAIHIIETAKKKAEGELTQVEREQIKQIDMLQKDNLKAIEKSFDPVEKAQFQRRAFQLGQQREQIIQGSPKPAAAAAPVAAPAGAVVHRPQSKEEYDLIPSGESYYDSKGNLRRKK